MSSPKSKTVLQRLGQDVRGARLRRGMAVTDLAARSGASASTLARLEKGDAGVALGTLADVLVVLGLTDKLAGLLDVRKDDLGLALSAERAPRRGRTFAATMRKRKVGADKVASSTEGVDKLSAASVAIIDPDGVGF